MDPYADHFLSQTGGSYDLGIGPVYRAGFTRQRGRGLGSIFRNIVSFVTPLFKSGASALGKAALQTGANIVSDIAASDGNTSTIKEIAKRRAIETRDNMTKRMRGAGRRKRGQAAKKRKSASVARPKKTKRRRINRRTKGDIFGGV